ncbi:MAG: Pyrophosphatase PpaX [candidate division WS6 bacterium OLB20]|uniref:Pyrophosphatase PpaX n=1 Tax=candidate division WS6 bacterium OLB20 TaxID=1617426 RepID=A0A136LWP0_9BACT|nr:MAG: Pyrophosphatase PpaX [candidate division WS6 bacterium OLB20]
MNKPILCFDLDDTLIDDNYKFELTFCDCIRTIILALETRSPQIDEILQTARELDNHKWETWPKTEKYFPKRIAESWTETYEKLAVQQNIPVKPHIKRLIWAQVMTNYDPPYFVIPDVVETLVTLQERGYRMEIITAGLQPIQMRKLKVSHLIKYFADVHVSYDKSMELKQLSDKHGTENLVMIGNSLRSDINPALELGIRSIYIPRGSWHQFKSEPFNTNYEQLNSLSELKQIFT